MAKRGNSINVALASVKHRDIATSILLLPVCLDWRTTTEQPNAFLILDIKTACHY
jgi:hypothetical protein